jgi:small subunit ribosomal protein S17
MRKEPKSMIGRVVSDKMDKTVIVVVESLTRHPLYGKTLKTRKRYFAHDASSASRVGDLVRIEETRPVSKRKRWKIAEIVEQAQ